LNVTDPSTQTVQLLILCPAVIEFLMALLCSAGGLRDLLLTSQTALCVLRKRRRSVSGDSAASCCYFLS